MRIAITTNYRRLIGGAQTYLHRLLPALRLRGHEVALWYEFETGETRGLIAAPEIPSWGVDTLGAATTLRALRDWRPDIIYSHGVNSPEWEAETLQIAPGILFLHDFYGACISGSKTHSAPTPVPCAKPFGAACLLHYFPRRCGGLNPVTMLREYQRQQQRARLLARYQVLLTHSDYMVREYQRYGFSAERLRAIPFLVPPPAAEIPDAPRASLSGEVKLLFLGRMETLKGGHYLLHALPELARRLQRPVTATLAGDGTERDNWGQLAAQLSSPQVNIAFPGWVDAATKAHLLQSHHLLVVPSLWPEPFGMTGIEAGYFGVPAAAFKVGGVEAWLQPGVNGHLAPGDPPRPEGLATAMFDCLNDEDHYRSLCLGARRQARQFSEEIHLTELLKIFSEVAGTGHRQSVASHLT